MLSRKYLTPARLSERGRRYPTSRTWTACKDGGMIFNKGLKWSISNGETVNAWDDFWLASSLLRKQIQGPWLKGKGIYLSRTSFMMVLISPLFSMI